MLRQSIQEDLKNAMMAKDEVKTSTLRLLKSAITYFEIEKGGAGYEASDQEILDTIAKEAKKRRESIELYKTGGREELVNKETAELKVLELYLPEQMSEDEVRQIVKDTVQEVGVSSIQDMGKIMSALMPKVKGKTDGGVVSKIVKEELSR